MTRGTYRRLLDVGAVQAWLPGGRSLLFIEDGRLHALDIDSLDRTEVLALDPPAFIGMASVSPRGHWIYYTRVVNEGDIWMLEL